MTDTTKGLVAMIVACIGWGLSPIVFKALTGVPPIEVLAHRTVWSIAMFVVILAFQRQFRALFTAFTDGKRAFLLVIAALLVIGNWYLFIWAIQSGYATQTALGFYIFPLVMVTLGRLFFAEILSKAQWVSVGVATLAVCLLTYGTAIMPWISLILAGCFGIYGLIKKRLAMTAMVSVTAEMLVLLPIALLILWQTSHNGTTHFGGWDRTTALLIFSGPLTAIPMILFTYATAKLTMTSVGLISYINPTLQFFCAVVLFSEPFTRWHMAAFCLIWTALAIYSYASWRQENVRRKAARTLSASGISVM
jgi:chloramphenicol-sensitive protein RarD